MSSLEGALPPALMPHAAQLRTITTAVLADFGLPAAIVGLAVAAAMGSVVLALGIAFGATVVVALLLPRTIPYLLLFAFLFQNWFIATTAAWVTDLTLFDAMRATNFAVLAAAYGCFSLAILIDRTLVPPSVRRWLMAGWIVAGLVGAYLIVGLARGNGRDAILYLRNIITPLACFHIAMICGARYRHMLVPTLTVTALIVIGYGYSELAFTTDFLSLFGGDKYIALRMQDDIQFGLYARLLSETGFVLRDIEDFMKVPLFNITGLGDDAIQIFRLSGPNFHPISFAYAVAILSGWLFAMRVRWVVLLALPLMVFIGSKGALVLLLLLLGMILATKFLLPASAKRLLVVILIVYVASTLVLGIRGDDYHVLGLMAGLREFVANPFGHGLGSGGVTSTAGLAVDWEQAQSSGAASLPVESAVGVLLYQMGVAAFAFFAFVLAIGGRCWRAFAVHGRPEFLFGAVCMWTISVNAIFQEEAFFAPLALGSCMIFVGLSLGDVLSREWMAEETRRGKSQIATVTSPSGRSASVRFTSSVD